MVATGQCGGHDKNEALPHIRVWNSVTLATTAVIGYGEFAGSVNCISFSLADSGLYLVAVDDAPDKIISVWEWQKGDNGHRVTETRVCGDDYYNIFHPIF